MKFSEAILCGYEKVNGRQHIGGYSNCAEKPEELALCVLGAGSLCLIGQARMTSDSLAFEEAFEKAWGFNPAALNDGRMEGTEPMPWEHIYGMAVAADL
jgi:hypothetical protein